MINGMGTPACTFKQLWDNVDSSDISDMTVMKVMTVVTVVTVVIVWIVMTVVLRPREDQHRSLSLLVYRHCNEDNVIVVALSPRGVLEFVSNNSWSPI